MRRSLIPLLTSIASLGVVFTAANGAVLPTAPENSFRAAPGLRFSPEVEEEARALRQSLFKKPSIPIVEPRSKTAPSTRPRTPTPPTTASRPPIRPPVIAPPPRPREVSLAMRELSLQPAGYTPYDRYSGTVRQVIARVDRQPPSMARARALMQEAYSFRYRTADPYQAALPEKTAVTRTGDCKAKSLWLYDQLGDASAFYVIGKTIRGTKSNHAWLYWYSESRWWILDPTNRSTPIAAASIPVGRYVPYYSFGKEGAYRHKDTYLSLPGSLPATATVSAPASRSRVARK